MCFCECSQCKQLCVGSLDINGTGKIHNSHMNFSLFVRAFVAAAAVVVVVTDVVVVVVGRCVAIYHRITFPLEKEMSN